jgi:hypothetical protein
MDPMQGTEDSPLSLLKNPWESQLSELLSLPRQTLLLACPFITKPVADWVSQRLTENTDIQQVQILFLTNIRMESVLAGVLELEGLAQLGRTFSRLCLVHMPSLHAKVYVADEQYAIITSGNLTGGGSSIPCERKIQPSNLLQHDRIPSFKGTSTNRRASSTYPANTPRYMRRQHRPRD